MKACFMGLGYIGLPTAIIAAKHGVEVVGVDVNADVVEVTTSENDTIPLFVSQTSKEFLKAW